MKSNTKHPADVPSEMFHNQSKNEERDILPPHVLENIAKGQADIIAGRTISFDEFKKRLTISNR